MQGIKPYSLITRTAIAIGMLAVLLPFAAAASEMSFYPLEEQLKKATGVVKIQTTDVHREDVVSKINGKTEVMNLRIEGNVMEKLSGRDVGTKVKAVYSQAVPIEYDANGNVVSAVSFLIDGSGTEWDTENGKTYILSYSSVQDDGTLNLLRIDGLDKEEAIKKAIRHE